MSTAAASAATTIGIPRLLWEAMETTLWTHSRNYVRELARNLGVREDALLKEVLPSKDTLQVYIQESPEDCPTDFQCPALIGGGNSAKVCAFRCRKTIEKGYSYCSDHVWRRPDIQPRITPDLPIPKRLRRLATATEDTACPLWCDDSGFVLDADANVRGYYDKETHALYML